ncbi:hypothetical protein TIFTF001_049030 [Ficus carica]|uniref:Uncharacterized protein n=1 Tax=Ficus carica TaxID=3494 RepID=A0AA88CN14_FICCA|nr:hypothetical protein TIFTF001_049030 [Ficus carica]
MKEITTVTYRDRRGILGNHDGLPWRPSWSPGETTTVSPGDRHDGLAWRPSWSPGETTTVTPGDRRGLSPVVVLHATTVSPGEWPSW